jgi:hypothetical protein
VLEKAVTAARPEVGEAGARRLAAPPKALTPTPARALAWPPTTLVPPQSQRWFRERSSVPPSLEWSTS